MAKEVELNGVQFEVWAEHVGGGFFGKWTCLECSETSGSNHRDPTEERAIAAVQIGASLHAERKHPKKAAP